MSYQHCLGAFAYTWSAVHQISLSYRKRKAPSNLDVCCRQNWFSNTSFYFKRTPSSVSFFLKSLYKLEGPKKTHLFSFLTNVTASLKPSFSPHGGGGYPSLQFCYIILHSIDYELFAFLSHSLLTRHSVNIPECICSHNL